MSLTILGLGTALPPHTVDQLEAADHARHACCTSDEQSRVLRALYRRSGVARRHTVLPHRMVLDYLEPAPHGPALGPSTAERMALYAEHAPPLALRAAHAALEESGLAAREISHLVTVSCTGFAAPGVDIALINELRLRPTIERTHVGYMGCHGALNGLRVARALCGSDPHACVLLCAVELCSLHFGFEWDPLRLVGNAIFADGAAALVGRNASGEGSWRHVANGSCLVPDSSDAMSWNVGDHGFEMMLSPRVPDHIGSHLRPWLASWLDGHGLTIEQVASWAVHPGGPRILSAVEASLGLPPTALAISRELLGELGNMSSPTVLFIVDRLRRRGALRPCVALGFGPGLAAEAALFA